MFNPDCCFVCNSQKITIFIFHPVNNDCIVRKRNYNDCIIKSILHNSWCCENMRFAPTDVICTVIDNITHCANRIHGGIAKLFYISLYLLMKQCCMTFWLDFRVNLKSSSCLCRALVSVWWDSANHYGLSKNINYCRFDLLTEQEPCIAIGHCMLSHHKVIFSYCIYKFYLFYDESNDHFLKLFKLQSIIV